MGKKYSKEFKEEAVRRALSGDESRKGVARSLGINYYTLRDWIREMGPIRTETIAKSGNVDEMRRELERLREENEILKKFATIVAKERDQ